MTDPLDLAPIQAREQAASPGPWWNDSHEIYAGPTDNTAGSDWVGETCRVNDPAGSDADGAFIAHARQDVPDLIAEVLRLRAIETAARRLLAHWTTEQDQALAYSDSHMGTEPGNNAYQRGATYENCADDLTHVLDHGTVPRDYLDLDELPEPASTEVSD